MNQLHTFLMAHMRPIELALRERFPRFYFLLRPVGARSPVTVHRPGECLYHLIYRTEAERIEARQTGHTDALLWAVTDELKALDTAHLLRDFLPADAPLSSYINSIEEIEDIGDVSVARYRDDIGWSRETD